MELDQIVKKLKSELKEVSGKRVLVLSGIMLFAVSIVFCSVFISTRESVANTPFQPASFKDIMKDKGQNIGALYKDSYAEVSKRDKDLAYLLLREKFKGKNVAFTLYKVKLGENFWGIAKDHGVNIDTIIAANPDMNDLKSYSNQQVIIPSKRGVIHEVNENGENAATLANVYKVDKAEIEKNNDLFLGMMNRGDLIFIPDAKPVFISENLKKLFAKRNMFRSPLSGKYTSLTGVRIHPVTGDKTVHQGVDIKADMGSWVGASADGTVIFAGWAGNLGYAVKIKHKDGYMSVYGHLSKIFVHEGQKVFAGKLVAKTGNSGRTTGPHLHFAIYKDGSLQDPLKFLW